MRVVTGREPDDMDGSDGNDEPALRAAVLNGDGAAWEILYERARGPVRRLVGRRVPAREIDDVVQETWMTAVRRIASFEPRIGTFTGWVLGIAARTALAALRRGAGAQGSPWCRESGDALRGSAGLGAMSGGSAESEDASAAVQETLRALPARYRMVLQAKYEQGLAVEEIASRSGATAKAIESLLSRARDAFRTLYRPSET